MSDLKPRLSVAMRIALIGVLALGAGWLVLIALLSWSRSDEGGPLPPPHQLAALAVALEQSEGVARDHVLAAVGSDVLSARLERRNDRGDAASELRRTRSATRDIEVYRKALAPRLVSIGAAPEQQRFPRLMAAGPNAVEFRIALVGGGMLVVDTRRASFVTILGLPGGIGAGLFASIIALIAVYLIHRQTRPLAELVAAIDRLDLAGAPEMLAEPRRSVPEIHALVLAFNRLQQRLSHLLTARMAMLGGISHDVRSVATRLRLRVEHISNEIERMRAISDIADMIRLLDDALLASRAASGELTQELIEFAAFVESHVVDRVAQGAEVSLVVGVGGAAAMVLGDRLALRRIFGNLIDNALAYGSCARLTVTADAAQVWLVIDDDGPGIPRSRRAMMFEPFVRLETSRNRGTGGAGLGLAIVRSLVEAHGGAVELADGPTGGARVSVTLPLFAAQ